MKLKSLLLGITLAIFATVTPVIAQIPLVSYTDVFETTQRNLRQVILDDGIYELVVDYESHTSHRTRYVLEVRIQNDNVTAIYFDNGGSVHSGWNNSGYSWSGGGIRWNTDYYGNITSGYAVIQVTYQGGGWQLFTVRLQ